MKIVFSIESQHKKPGVAILISAKIDLKGKNVLLEIIREI